MKTTRNRPTQRITHCAVTNTTAPANEQTRAAVEALAKAAEVNAHAIMAIARALQGGDATIENGIRLGS